MSNVIRIGARITGRVEVVRSFSYKLNVGNYESRDFFCSTKAECDAEDMSEVAADLDMFAQDQVLESVKEYRSKIERQRGPQKERKTA